MVAYIIYKGEAIDYNFPTAIAIYLSKEKAEQALALLNEILEPNLMGEMETTSHWIEEMEVIE